MVVHRVLHYSRKLASLGKQYFILQTELTKRVLNTQAATGMNLNQEFISKPSHAISKLEENEGFPPINESYLICSHANFEIMVECRNGKANNQFRKYRVELAMLLPEMENG